MGGRRAGQGDPGRDWGSQSRAGGPRAGRGDPGRDWGTQSRAPTGLVRVASRGQAGAAALREEASLLAGAAEGPGCGCLSAPGPRWTVGVPAACPSCRHPPGPARSWEPPLLRKESCVCVPGPHSAPLRLPGRRCLGPGPPLGGRPTEQPRPSRSQQGCPVGASLPSGGDPSGDAVSRAPSAVGVVRPGRLRRGGGEAGSPPPGRPDPLGRAEPGRPPRQEDGLGSQAIGVWSQALTSDLC